MIDFDTLDAAQGDAILKAVVATRHAAETSFRRRWRSSGAPDLKNTLDDLHVVEAWYREMALSNEPDGRDDVPVWWGDRPFEASVRRLDLGMERPVSPQYVRLADEVSAFVARVVAAQVPGARWVRFTRLQSRGDIRKNQPMLVLGDPLWPSDPIGHVYTIGLAAATRPSAPPPPGMSMFERYSGEVEAAWRWLEQHQGLRRKEWTGV